MRTACGNAMSEPNQSMGGHRSVGLSRAWLAWLMAALFLATASSRANSADSKPLAYCIVVTGGELLEGVYLDAHTPFLTRTLRPLGCQCVGSLTVDDEPNDIQAALRFATNRAPLVIVTGGLGPTPNDITRETLSAFTGIPLREQPEVLAEMERRFNQSRDQLRPNLRRQTQVPVKGGFLKNSVGTAVGLVFDLTNAVIVALPGPPRELQAMARDELLPLLRQRFGIRQMGSSLTLRFVGAGQSLIDQTIKDHVTVAPDVIITSLFEGSRVDFTFSLPGHEPADQDRLRTLEGHIREHLNEYLYADDQSSLEEVIINKLRTRGETLVLVEVGSGGSLVAALQAARGAEGTLKGAYVGASDDAVATLLGHGAEALPAAPVERLQKLGAWAAAKADWILAVGPIDTSENSAAAVWVACQTRDGRWQTQRLLLRNPGEISRATLATQVLDLLRRKL